MRIIFAVLLCGLTASAKKRYDGYKLITFSPDNQIELDRVMFWYLNTELDFWEDPSTVGQPVQIFASPEWLVEIEKLFDFYVLNDHIQQDIEEEEARMALKREQFNGYDYGDFNDYETVMAEVDRQVTEFCPPSFTCTKLNAGSTIEGEPTYYYSVTKNGESDRKTIWIDSTIHAREWLATTTMVWITRQLLERYEDSDDHPLNDFDFYLMPVVNPDGYKYTHSNERLWRKNRRNNEGSTCFGVDLNRNFDYEFRTSGTSTNPCSNTYGGASAASEPEIQNQQKVMDDLMDSGVDIRAGISMHTYGRYWLIPFGHQSGGSCVGPPADLAALNERVASATQSVGGGNWRRGSTCSTLYPMSGNTIDYMYAVTGIPYVFLPELRGTNFIINKSEIKPAFDEIWAGLEVIFDEV